MLPRMDRLSSALKQRGFASTFHYPGIRWIAQADEEPETSPMRLILSLPYPSSNHTIADGILIGNITTKSPSQQVDLQSRDSKTHSAQVARNVQCTKDQARQFE